MQHLQKTGCAHTHTHTHIHNTIYYVNIPEVRKNRLVFTIICWKKNTFPESCGKLLNRRSQISLEKHESLNEMKIIRNFII